VLTATMNNDAQSILHHSKCYRKQFNITKTKQKAYEEGDYEEAEQLAEQAATALGVPYTPGQLETTSSPDAGSLPSMPPTEESGDFDWTLIILALISIAVVAGVLVLIRGAVIFSSKEK